MTTELEEVKDRLLRAQELILSNAHQDRILRSLAEAIDIVDILLEALNSSDEDEFGNGSRD